MNKDFFNRIKQYLIIHTNTVPVYLDNFYIDPQKQYTFVLTQNNPALLRKIIERCLVKQFKISSNNIHFISDFSLLLDQKNHRNLYSCNVFSYDNYIQIEKISLLQSILFYICSNILGRLVHFKVYISFVKILANSTEQSLTLKKQKMIQSVCGPGLQKSQTIKELLQTSYYQNETIENKLKKSQVNQILNDMIGSFHHVLGALAYLTVKLFCLKIFKPFEIKFVNAPGLRKHLTNASVVYVPNHKSHIDYLLLSISLYKYSFFPPHIAAGINLSFFPVGPILSRLGAFFIRRSIGSNKHYAFLLAQYIRYLVVEKIPQAVFFEGGRSRTGKLLDPKLGILTYQLQALEKNNDIVFVPVSINYDYIPELTEITRQLAGAKKKKENIFSFIWSFPKVLRRCGRVRLHFHEGISAQDFFKNHALEKSSIQLLAKDILRDIASVTACSRGFVLAIALFKQLFYTKDINEPIYIDYLLQDYHQLIDHFFHEDKTIKPHKSFKRMLHLFRRHDILSRDKNSVRLNKKKFAKLFYLRNTSIHTIFQHWLLQLNPHDYPESFFRLLCAWNPGLNLNPRYQVHIKNRALKLWLQQLLIPELSFIANHAYQQSQFDAQNNIDEDVFSLPHNLKRLFEHDFKRIKPKLSQQDWQDIFNFCQNLNL
ncbi:MAG TPA: glycerol-3-phosphate acyltransferase [Oligoflexia bacterium]|nr:glycerol-3-phosphate acyltransferase [Oligoflexia bacterium]HMR25531.1 glycerol-3-phosphate acyltransferase [Oligoflexia bacterium]